MYKTSEPTRVPRPVDPAPSRLPDVSVPEIVAFLAVVRCRGFTNAAAFLHLSQPGVSSRVRRLERALGVTLIDRSVRQLTLTPQGAAFLPEAQALVGALALGLERAQAASCRPIEPGINA